MKDLSVREWLTLIFIGVILSWSIIGFKTSEAEFKKACDEVGGKVVWDGRQNQCLRREK